MANIINEIGIENCFSILIIINLILLIGFIITILKTEKLKKKYENFMNKLGNGKTIEEDLENYMYRVERVEKQNAEITNFIQIMDKEMEKCIQKIGMVRYSAFKDTGSDLSFALALLNDKNDGVILNGIYSREMSNIYAKQVIAGKCSNKLSEEERQALEIAIN